MMMKLLMNMWLMMEMCMCGGDMNMWMMAWLFNGSMKQASDR